MIPKTKHRDHDIAFDPQTEEWKCGNLMLSDKSLSKLQAAIDRESKKRRRVSVPAYWLDAKYKGNCYVHTVVKCSIMLLREGERNAYIKIDGKREQQLVAISDLYSLGQKAKLDAFVAAKNEASAAEDRASEIQDGLTAFNAAAIREEVARQADEAA